MKEKKQELVPEVRFPEFSGDWDVKTLGEVFDLRNGYTPSKGNPEYWENGAIPWFRMEDIRENGHILSDAIQHITPEAIKGGGLFKKGSFILATTATIGEHALLIADSLANQQFTNLQIHESQKDNFETMYLYYYLFIVDEFCKMNVNQGGFYSVDMPSLRKCPIPFPSPSEQKKIAECLSSVDESIKAEDDRLQSLKDHKKGLMQKLFPKKGETIPEVRFPEFSGEWNLATIEELSDILDFNRKPITENMRESGPYPYYGASGIVDYVKDFIFDGEYLLVSEDGANLLARTTPIAFSICGKNWVNNHAHVLLFSSCSVQKYCESYLNFIDLSDYITGLAQPKLNKEQLKKITITIPSSHKEVKKIADCLSSLDDEIAAQQQKVDALKEHKKGLMQKMFPKISNN